MAAPAAAATLTEGDQLTLEAAQAAGALRRTMRLFEPARRDVSGIVTVFGLFAFAGAAASVYLLRLRARRG